MSARVVHCDYCDQPARWAGTWRTATMPAPAFVYVCDEHRDRWSDTELRPFQQMEDVRMIDATAWENQGLIQWAGDSGEGADDWLYCLDQYDAYLEGHLVNWEPYIAVVRLVPHFWAEPCLYYVVPADVLQRIILS